MKTEEWINSNATRGGRKVIDDKLYEAYRAWIRVPACDRTPDDRKQIRAIMDALHVLRQGKDEIFDCVEANLPDEFRWQDPILQEWREVQRRQHEYIAKEIAKCNSTR